MERKYFLFLLLLGLGFHSCHYFSSEEGADKVRARMETKRRRNQIAKAFHEQLPEVEEVTRDKYRRQLLDVCEAHQHSARQELASQLWDLVEEHNRLRAENYARRIQALQAREQAFFRSQFLFLKDMEVFLSGEDGQDIENTLDSLYKKHDLRQQQLLNGLGRFLADSVAAAILKRLYTPRKKPINPKETMQLKTNKDNPKFLSTRRKEDAER